MTTPLFSVITVTWNLLSQGRRDTFEGALRCVQSQGFKDIEHIVLDGASSDGTPQFIEGLVSTHGAASRAIPIRFHSEPDKGLYDAMNKAVAMARGVYVVFLNSDDSLAGDDLFEKLARLIDQTPVDFLYGSTLEIRSDGSTKEFSRVNLFAFLQRMPFCHNSFLIRRELFEKLGGHDTGYRVAADYDFVFRMLCAGVSGKNVGFPISVYSSRGVSADRLAVAKDYAKVWEQYYRQLLPENRWSFDDYLEMYRIGQLPIGLCLTLIRRSESGNVMRRAAIHSLKIAARRKLQPWRRWDNISG